MHLYHFAHSQYQFWYQLLDKVAIEVPSMIAPLYVCIYVPIGLTSFLQIIWGASSHKSSNSAFPSVCSGITEHDHQIFLNEFWFIAWYILLVQYCYVLLFSLSQCFPFSDWYVHMYSDCWLIPFIFVVRYLKLLCVNICIHNVDTNPIWLA